MNGSAAYPITYRVSKPWQVFMYAAAIAAIAAGADGLWNLADGNGTGDPRGDTFLHGLCLAFLAFGLLTIAYVAAYKITLDADAIALTSLMGSRRLRRSEIEGYQQRVMPHGPPLLVFVPHERQGKAIKMSQVVKIDDRFLQWMAGIPNLDDVQRAAAQAEVESDTKLGATPDERVYRVAQGHRVVREFHIVTVVFCGWLFFYPQPYTLAACLLAAIPPAALLLLFISRGQYRLDSAPNDVRPNVAMLFVGPGAVLALRAMIDYDLLNWQDGMKMAGIGAIVFGILLGASNRGAAQKTGVIVLFALIMASYGYGAGTLANALFDKSPAKSFQTRLQAKSISAGTHPTYDLTLAPWGTKTDVDEVTVKALLYDRLAVGDKVCIALHQGALGAAWYKIDACQ